MIFRSLWQSTVLQWLLVMFASGQSHPDLGSLQDFPVSEEVWLASAVGDVTVSPELKIETSLLGPVEWQVPDGSEVEKDQILCFTSSEKITLSERELALKRSKLGNTIRDLEISFADREEALRTSTQEVGEKLLELQLTPTEQDLLGDAFVNRIKKERKLLENQLERMNAKLNSEYFEVGLADEKTASQLDIDNAEFAHKDLTRNSEIRAEVGGRLKIFLEKVVTRDTTIGVIVQDEIAEGLLEMSDPRIRNVPSELLRVTIGGDDGRIYRGVYERTVTENAMMRGVPVFVFKIEAGEDGEAIPDSLNGSRMFRVHRKLGVSGHLVPKADLLFQHPDEINDEGWSAFITKRWPDTELVFVGPKHLVVRGIDEN